MGNSSKSSIQIAILFPTYWEARKYLEVIKVTRVDFCTYESRSDGQSLVIQICGIGKNRARESMQKLLLAYPSLSMLIIAGFAGALQNQIQAGDIVIDSDRSDPNILNAVLESTRKNLLTLHRGKFYTAQKPLLRSKEKIAAGKETGAIAVEMESESISEVCSSKQIRFCSLRSVCDDLQQNLPEAVRYFGMGKMTGFRFIKELASRPKEWADFIRLVKSANIAGKNLALFLKYLVNEIRSAQK